MPLVYLPDVEALFLWGAAPAPRELPAALGRSGAPWSVALVTPEGRHEVDGLRLPLLESMVMLAVVPAADVEAPPASMATWALASKLAMELVSRESAKPGAVTCFDNQRVEPVQ